MTHPDHHPTACTNCGREYSIDLPSDPVERERTLYYRALRAIIEYSTYTKKSARHRAEFLEYLDVAAAWTKKHS